MLFERLILWEDFADRSAEEQMAVDEVLLDTVDTPLLRIYRWSKPCVSIGYFGSWTEAEQLHLGLPVIRRWTGGGMVEHGADMPYSLVVPSASPLCRIRPGESYNAIHRLVAQALAAFGVNAQLVEQDHPKQSNTCFANPVAGDLLANGRKAAGAGQRRTRRGLLHQGSIQLALTGIAFGQELAGGMSRQVVNYPRPDSLLERARQLVAEKYGSTRWREGKP
jgi:lipoate-protein ligase A